MKKLFLIFALVSFCFAAAPTDEYSDAGIISEWLEYDTIDTNGAYDTIVSTDSSTLKSNWQPKTSEGWQYYLVHDAMTCSDGQDSTKIQLRLDVKNKNKTLIYSVAVDSLTLVGEAIKLPIGTTAIGGAYYDLKAVGYTGNSGNPGVILNRFYITRTRPEIFMRRL